MAFPLRVAMWLGCAAVWLPFFASANADAIDDSLRVYAVNILQHPEQSWPGYGIYLGKGLVITAAHVVGAASRTKPSVRIASQDLPAKVIKEGALDQVDLTLLAVNEQELPISLQLRRMPLCRNSPFVGEAVIVVIPEGTARSRIMSPRLLPANVRNRFNTVISDVATTGNSGSGVFDAQRKCLLGIMSRKIQIQKKTASSGKELQDLAKYFVPAPTIRDFIPAEFPF
jgi:S1-C subfamily serine protease